MKKFWNDFKAFISKGNVLDLAVAVIIGGAFNKIVSSLVNDVIMPLISLAIGGADVSEWKWVIKAATETTPETALRYGIFIQAIIDFLIIAFTIFVIVKIFTFSKNKLKQAGEQLKTETKKIKWHKKKKDKKAVAEQETEQITEQTTEQIAKEMPPETLAENITQEAEEVKTNAEEPVQEEISKEEKLLSEIRDLLKANLNKTEK